MVAVTENKSTGGEELLWIQHKWCPLVTKTAARWKPRRREKLTRRGDGGSGGASNSLDRLNVVFSLTQDLYLRSITVRPSDNKMLDMGIALAFTVLDIELYHL